MFVQLAVIWCVLIAQAFSQPSSSDVLLQRLHYINTPVVRYIAENEGLRKSLRGLNDAMRQKRFEGVQDYTSLEDPYMKRTSLKRLAILSARGFGRK
ncbi:hypothetical protein RB195_014799 [Necator americanus]